MLSAAIGAVLIGMLTMTVLPAFDAQDGPLASKGAPADELEGEILHPQHVARLGSVLFSRHLVAIEVAGTLLLAALVGAVAIVAHGKQSPSALSPDEPQGGRNA